MIGRLSRRELLRLGVVAAGAGGGGLAVGSWLGERRERWRKRAPERVGAFSPSALVAIEPDGSVVVWVNKTEVGQGVRTALPQLIAEELEADWSRVRFAQPHASRDFGEQLTAVSASIRREFDEHRRVGAIAREALIDAAARVWGVDRAGLFAERGAVVERATSRRLGYGELVAVARAVPLRADVPLKDPAKFTLIGRAVPRLDVPDKVTGAARFAFDRTLPGALVAALRRPPAIGAALEGFDPAPARAVAGVVEVRALDHAVAVLAEHTHAALEGARRLAPRWGAGPHAALDDAAVDAALETALRGGGRGFRQDGDVARALEGAARTLEAEYHFPYLAHVNLEPQCAVADVREGQARIWAPTQHPVASQEHVAKLLGVSPGDVTVFPEQAGTAFGRRVEQDVITEAVRLSQAVGRPVKVVWSREDEFKHDFYRPVARHRMTAGLDASGRLIAWRHALAAPSILAQKTGSARDPTAVEGLLELPYAIQAISMELHPVELPLPLGFWRSVGHSHNAFAVECFVDEVAEATRTDPVALRRELLAAHPRHLGVLERCASHVGWGVSGPPARAGQSWGFAVHASFGSFVAVAAECAVDGASVRVLRVVVAVDCGRVVNPGIVAQQLEGGVLFGLGAALYGRIRLAHGAVVESGFHDHPVLRFDESPDVEVLIVPSDAAPTGVGEVGVPPIGPAVVSAVSRARGVRVRRLPLVGA